MTRIRRLLPVALVFANGVACALLVLLGVDTRAALLLPMVLLAGFLGAALTALPIVLSARLLERQAFLQRRLEDSEIQLRALTNLRPLLGDAVLSFGGWAIDPTFAELLAQVILDRRPRTIVECSCGSSTIVAAEALRRIGAGRVLSLEHDARYAEATRQRVAALGLDSWVQIIDAPLIDQTVGGETRRWYDLAQLEVAPGEIELLVVDGPPGLGSRDARQPAVPLLESCLSAEVVILIDDGGRDDEARMARQWSERLGASAEYRDAGSGAWLLQRSKSCGFNVPYSAQLHPVAELTS